MKALEFDSKIAPDSTVKVPPEVVSQIEKDRPIRVVLLVPEDGDEVGWHRLTAEQFLKGYSESDAIYDDLSAG